MSSTISEIHFRQTIFSCLHIQSLVQNGNKTEKVSKQEGEGSSSRHCDNYANLELAQSQIHKHLHRWTGLISKHIKNCRADVSHLNILTCSLAQYLCKQINWNVFGNLARWLCYYPIPTLLALMMIVRYCFGSPITTIATFFITPFIPSPLVPRYHILRTSETKRDTEREREREPCLRIGAFKNHEENMSTV